MPTANAPETVPTPPALPTSSPGARASAVASRVLEVLIGELVSDGDAALNVAGAGLRARTWLYLAPDGTPALVLA